MDFRPNDAALKAAKFDASFPVAIVAQPVAASIVTATHVQPTAQLVVAVQAVPVDSRQSPAGSWHDGLCDCFNDCDTCCCAWWCPIIMIAQLRQLLLGGSCMSTAIFLFVTICGGSMMQNMGGMMLEMYDNDDSDDEGVGGLMFGGLMQLLGGLMQLFGAVMSLIWTVSARTAMRVKEGIRPGECGQTEDCLFGFFCQCCTLGQMMRHVLNRRGTRGGAAYELCSPTGSASVTAV